MVIYLWHLASTQIIVNDKDFSLKMFVTHIISGEVILNAENTYFLLKNSFVLYIYIYILRQQQSTKHRPSQH